MTQAELNVEELVLDNIVISNASVESQHEQEPLAGKFRLEAEFMLEAAMSRAENKVRLSVKIDIHLLTASGEKLGVNGRFQIDFYYVVPNLANFSEVTEHGHFLDASVMVPLANISYSTARGVIFTRCQGTALQKVILPILSTSRIEEIVANPGNPATISTSSQLSGSGE